MKKIINKISRYIIGAWVMVVVFFLACVFNEDNFIADILSMPVFILFSFVTIMVILAYVIHLIWMIKSKRKPQNLKGDIISAATVLLLLAIYDICSNQFELNNILKQIALVMIVFISGEIFRYIYSWKE